METYAEVYDKPCFSLSPPTRIGDYSSHISHVVFNKYNLRHLAHINVGEDLEPPYNLDSGFKNYIAQNPKDYQNDLIRVQKWAAEQWYDHDFNYKKVFQDAEIVCEQETLTRIASTPYSPEDSWRVVAVRHNGIIYLHNCAVVDGNKFGIPMDRDEAHLRYWNCKFDQLMTSDMPYGEKHDYSEVVNCSDTYSIVNQSDIIKPDGDRIKLAYSSEIKAVDENNNFVDFKLQASHLSNEFRLNKAWLYWLQCTLSSVDRVYVGIISDLGVVHKIHSVDKEYLRKSGGRKCDVVMTFLSTVLSEVKKRGTNTMQISYSPKTRRVHLEDATTNTDFLIRDFLKR